MSDLLKTLHENNAFDGMFAECPECANIEDSDYTCTTCWESRLSISNIIYNLEQQNKTQKEMIDELASEFENFISVCKQAANNDFKLKAPNTVIKNGIPVCKALITKAKQL